MVLMKAVVLEGVGSPFLVKDVPVPVPAEGEVLIRMHAAALNHRDLWIRKGQYAGLRFPSIQGSDGCGTVVRPDGVAQEGSVIINPSLNWGTGKTQGPDYAILGMAKDGTLAEYTVVPARLVHPCPAHLSAQQAAALPLGGLTAYRALFTRGRATPGENVLITGVGGGVAMLAMQFAIAQGCNVYVTSGDDNKLQKAMELGAKGGANYRTDGWHKQLRSQSGGFHTIVDSACGPGFPLLTDIALPGGRIVFYGATLGEFNSGVPAKIFWKQLDILGSTMGSDTEFESMLNFVSGKKVVPVVDSVFPIYAIDDAVAQMEKGKQFGKIVVTVSE
jgi:NADPH:quinone reductase-like Zn-dependent oxidoreductase